MSIIHDALKKAQTNLEKETGKSFSITDDKLYQTESIETLSENISANNRPQEKPNSTKKILLTGIFITLLITTSIAIYSLWSPNKNTSLSLPTIVQINSPEPIKPIKNVTDKITARPQTPKRVIRKPISNNSQILINGTMLMGGKHVALINGEIYEVGETIQNQKITNITLKNVEITNSLGEVTTLSVRHR
ncbi:hypothetical protein MNBD_BACTEROID05-845 [hydrothermal vent metagenome]|uniref:Uncharacterized protein n=1 Tax=hydrothermal vent metagenome TaxID=652676 RepID=A0A3B0T739_9ZZZZ